MGLNANHEPLISDLNMAHNAMVAASRKMRAIYGVNYYHAEELAGAAGMIRAWIKEIKREKAQRAVAS